MIAGCGFSVPPPPCHGMGPLAGCGFSVPPRMGWVPQFRLRRLAKH